MKTGVISILFIVLIFVVSCGVQDEPGYKKISAADGKAMLDTDENILLIDVRTKDEYDAGHIRDSILIPYDVIADKIDEFAVNKKQKIILYCRTGIRSQTAAETLTALGFSNVYDMGGIVDWPYEIITQGD